MECLKAGQISRFFKITFRTKSSGDGTDNIRCSYKESMRFLKYPTEKKNELTSISVNLFGVVYGSSYQNKLLLT